MNRNFAETVEIHQEELTAQNLHCLGSEGVKTKGLKSTFWRPVNMKTFLVLNEFFSCGLQKFDSQVQKSSCPLSTWQNLINYFRNSTETFFMLVAGSTMAQRLSDITVSRSNEVQES